MDGLARLENGVVRVVGRGRGRGRARNCQATSPRWIGDIIDLDSDSDDESGLSDCSLSSSSSDVGGMYDDDPKTAMLIRRRRRRQKQRLKKGKPKPVVEPLKSVDEVPGALREFMAQDCLKRGSMFYKDLRLIVDNLTPGYGMMTLLKKIGPFVRHLHLVHSDEAMKESWSMRKIFKRCQVLKTLVLKGNTLRLDWRVEDIRFTPIPVSHLTCFVVGMEYNTSTSESFQFGEFMSQCALYLRKVFIELADFKSNGYSTLSLTMGQLSRMNTSNWKQLEFFQKKVLFVPSNQTELKCSTFMKRVRMFPFQKMTSFRVPPFVSVDLDTAKIIEDFLLQTIVTMEKLTILNIIDTVFSPPFTFLQFQIPTLKKLYCNETAFPYKKIEDFEKCFPNLDELVIWSHSELLEANKVDIYYIWPDFDLTCSESYLALEHSKLQVLRMSFNFIGPYRGFMFQYPNLKHLDLRFNDCYVNAFRWILESMKNYFHHPRPFHTLSIAANKLGNAPLEKIMDILVAGFDDSKTKGLRFLTHIKHLNVTSQVTHEFLRFSWIANNIEEFSNLETLNADFINDEEYEMACQLFKKHGYATTVKNLMGGLE